MRKLMYFLIGLTLLVPLLTYDARAEENPCIDTFSCKCKIYASADTAYDRALEPIMNEYLKPMLKDEAGRRLVSRFLRETRCQFLTEMAKDVSDPEWCKKNTFQMSSEKYEDMAEIMMESYLKQLLVQMDIENPTWDTGCTEKSLVENELRKKK